MKKKLLSIFVFVSLFISISSAEVVHTTVSMPDQWDLNYITAKFCNQWIVKNKETIVLRPWQKKDICIAFLNSSEEKNIALSFGFSKAEKRSDGIFNCQGDTGMINNFMSYEPKNWLKTLNAKESYIMHVKVSAPLDLSWEFYWCFWYQLDKVDLPKDSAWMFSIMARKVSPITVSINWDIYNFGRRDDVKYFYKDNQMFILKTIAWILIILLIYYIIGTNKWKKQQKHNKK